MITVNVENGFHAKTGMETSIRERPTKTKSG